MSTGHSDHHDYAHDMPFEGMSADYRRRLMIVTGVNIAMFLVEIVAGQLAGSQALKADALDFFADGITYAISFWAIGRPVSTRTAAAFLKGLSLVAMGLWVAITTLYHFFYFGLPVAETMGAIGILAMAANVFTVWLLFSYKDGDANIRSVWLCSRNDAIGNVAVVLAAIMVAVIGNGAPDLIVAGVMAVLFLTSAFQIMRQSYAEWRAPSAASASPGEHHHEAPAPNAGDAPH